MQHKALALALIALLLGITLAAPSLRPSDSLSPSYGLRAAAVNLNLNYSDPASDVAKMWTSNNSHVTDVGGFWILNPSPASDNLIRVSSTDAGADVALYLRVQGSIATQSNISYEIRLYPRSDNSTHFAVTFSNGTTWLRRNNTVGGAVNLTSNTTISPVSTLNVAVSKGLLGNLSAWDIDASTKEVGTTYTYEDFVWSQPGNPGSAPAFIQGRVTDASNGTGLANVNVSTTAGGYFTSTDATGYYSLPAAPGNFTLTFSLTGYVTATKQVTVQYQQTATVNAALTKTAPPSEIPWLWIGVAGMLIAAVLVALLVLRRRKPVPPPKR